MRMRSPLKIWTMGVWIFCATLGFIIGVIAVPPVSGLVVPAGLAILFFLRGVHWKLFAIGLLLGVLPLAAFVPAGLVIGGAASGSSSSGSSIWDSLTKFFAGFGAGGFFGGGGSTPAPEPAPMPDLPGIDEPLGFDPNQLAFPMEP